MSLVYILVLLVVWGAAGIWWVLNRPEGHSTDSIGTFRHQLRVLERTGPTTVDPATRMDDVGLVYGSRRIPTRSLRPGALAGSPAASAHAMLRTIGPAARRRRVQKRRRDVFFGLLAAVIGSSGLGFLPGLSAMWWLAALLAGILALYVVVLVQLRAVGSGRARPDAPVAPMVPSEPAYVLPRSVN